MSSDGERFSRVFWVVTGIHIALIFGVGLFSAIHRWMNRRPPPEAITFVSLQTPAPEPVSEPAPAEPEPPPPTPPPPEAAPPPPRPRIEPSRERIRRPDTPAPRPAPQPQLTPEQIAQRLAESATPREAPRTAGSPDDLSRYYALLHETLYRAWSQPGSVLPGSSAVARIRVQRDGRITEREIIRSSRSSAMDDSIMRALRSVNSVSPLPSVISGAHHDFTIEFELTGAQF